jgi:3',5'-cyclic-AMP phosphodiesterase
MLPEIEIKTRNPDCIRVVQITDTHIFKDVGGCFDGVDTTASLKAVIAHIKQQAYTPDIVIVTGDLVHDPVPTAYERLREQLLGLDSPVVCLPGNHDDPVLMHGLLNQDNVHTDKAIKVGEWGIVLLDTYLADTHSGRLRAEEINFLEQQLSEYSDRPVLICLHHPPVSVASPWMDAMMLENPEDLFSVLDKHKNVRALVWGHIHQVFMTKRHEVLLSASPSTCVQFKPESEEYIKDEMDPGYTEIELHQGGSIDFRIQRI